LASCRHIAGGYKFTTRKTTIPTLNKDIIYPELRLKLKYHKSRKPDNALVDKIGDSLELARKMTNEALVQLRYVAENRKDKNKYPTAWAAAEYHLKLTEWDKDDRKNVCNIMEKTASGLNDRITISDVLSPSIIDLYKVYLRWTILQSSEDFANRRIPPRPRGC
jgi:hypothetical protein